MPDIRVSTWTATPWRVVSGCVLGYSTCMTPVYAGTLIGGERVGVNFNIVYLDNSASTVTQAFS